MNTILLPRAIALECQLNGTLSNLDDMTSGDILYGADLYYTNESEATSSSHIVVTISKNLTGAEAMQLLDLLMYNSTGGRVGNNVTISSNDVLYLLHLPSDVLQAIPSYIDNAGLGRMPDYISIGDVLSDIGDFLFDCLVFIAEAGTLYLWAHMVEIGLDLLCVLIDTAVDVVQEAVDAIVAAFNWFVDWLVEYVEKIVESMAGDVLGNAEIGKSQKCGNILTDTQLTASSVDSNQITQSEGASRISEELLSYIYSLIVLATVVTAALLVISLMFLPYTALLNEIVVPIIISLMVTVTVNILRDAIPNLLNSELISSQLKGIMSNEVVNGVLLFISLLVGVFSVIWDKAAVTVATDVTGIFCLAISLAGLSFSICSVFNDDPVGSYLLSCIGYILSESSAVMFLFDYFEGNVLANINRGVLRFMTDIMIIDMVTSTLSLGTATVVLINEYEQ